VLPNKITFKTVGEKWRKLGFFFGLDLIFQSGHKLVLIISGINIA
jgi:hypothetical protein